MDNKYLVRKKMELVNSSSKKLQIVFCIDVSDSMNLITKGTGTYVGTEFRDGKTVNLYSCDDNVITLMDELKNRVKDFNEAMKNEKATAKTCQTAYVTFGEGANLFEDFGLVKNKETNSVDELCAADDKTEISEGISLSLDILDEQVKLCKESGVSNYVPWLIIFTDGISTESEEKVRSIKRELVARQKAEKLIVYTMALSNDPQMNEQIRGYSINKPIPYDANLKKITEFFTFLKDSVSKISTGRIYGKMPSFTEPEDEIILS